MNLKAFFNKTKTEIAHVVWPTRKRAVIYTLLLLAFSLALGYLLFGFDFLFKAGLERALY